MRLFGLLGVQVHIRVQSMWQTRGSGYAPPGNFDFEPFIDAIWWNLKLIYHLLCH